MPRDGSGTFALVAGNPVVTGTTISSTVQNNTMNDVAAALTASVANDGQTTPTADLKMGGFKFKNVANATSRISTNANFASAADVQDGTITYLTTVAGTNTITASAPLGMVAYVTGQRFTFIPAATNTAAATLNINSIGAKNLFSNGAIASKGALKISVPAEVIYDGTQFHILASGVSSTVSNLSKTINGMTYANAAGDVVNDLDIAAGACVDATGVYWITTSALTKQLDAAWAVGSGAGGLDTGSIGNSDYYIWAIARSDTGVTDYLYSLSSTAPTMPASYDYKRLIGWFKRVGATIVLFHTYETEGGGLEQNWDSPTLDINLANTLTTARRTDAIKVPLNFSVLAVINVNSFDASNSHTTWVYCPDQTDLAPSGTAAPLSNAGASVGLAAARQLTVRTSATGTIAARSDLATVDLYAVSTMGFRWARRN